jgi:hypothetical protein
VLGQVILRGNVDLVSLLDSNWCIAWCISSNGLPFISIKSGNGSACGTFVSVDGFCFADLSAVEEDFDVDAAVVDTNILLVMCCQIVRERRKERVVRHTEE